jgi:hypothetical protein
MLGFKGLRYAYSASVGSRGIALAKEGSRDAIVLRDRVVSSFRNGVGSGH